MRDNSINQKNDRDFSIIKNRIIQYLDFKNISKYEFYKLTGITNGILSQKNGLSEENTLKFLSYFEDVNTDWLFRGIGEKEKKNGETVNVVEEERSEYKSPISSLEEKERTIMLLMQLNKNNEELMRHQKEEIERLRNEVNAFKSQISLSQKSTQ